MILVIGNINSFMKNFNNLLQNIKESLNAGRYKQLGKHCHHAKNGYTFLYNLHSNDEGEICLFDFKDLTSGNSGSLVFYPNGDDVDWYDCNLTDDEGNYYLNVAIHWADKNLLDNLYKKNQDVVDATIQENLANAQQDLPELPCSNIQVWGRSSNNSVHDSRWDIVSRFDDEHAQQIKQKIDSGDAIIASYEQADTLKSRCKFIGDRAQSRLFVAALELLKRRVNPKIDGKFVWIQDYSKGYILCYICIPPTSLDSAKNATKEDTDDISNW